MFSPGFFAVVLLISRLLEPEKGVPVVPPEPSLSGSALWLCCQLPVQNTRGAMPADVIAFKALHPIQSVTARLPSDILKGPLFFKRQIPQPAAGPATTDSACPSAA